MLEVTPLPLGASYHHKIFIQKTPPHHPLMVLFPFSLSPSFISITYHDCWYLEIILSYNHSLVYGQRVHSTAPLAGKPRSCCCVDQQPSSHSRQGEAFHPSVTYKWRAFTATLIHFLSLSLKMALASGNSKCTVMFGHQKKKKRLTTTLPICSWAHELTQQQGKFKLMI